MKKSRGDLSPPLEVSKPSIGFTVIGNYYCLPKHKTKFPITGDYEVFMELSKIGYPING